MQYRNARDLCLKHFPSDPARFYGPAAGLPLGAGILLRDCVVAVPHETEVRYETGVGPALILTHECDIDPSNDRHFNDLLLVCPIIPLDDFCVEYEQEGGAGSWGGILQAIAGNIVHRAMYLPPFPEMEGGGIIYLNNVSSCRVAWITDLSDQAICSLSARGLQMFDFKLTNHLFREKAVPLLFGR